MRWIAASFLVVAPAWLSACGGTSSSGFGNAGMDAGTMQPTDGSPSSLGDTSVPSLGDGSTPVQNGKSIIYANTDSELYSMDPDTHVVTDIGPFSDGSNNTPTITDLAVDAAGDVYVNSETAIYRAALPSSGTGSVALTLVTNLSTSTKFYALGFTPAGALETGESLVAGDSAGNLYYIPVTSGATPQLLGGFGGSWELSGDVVFYSLNGAPRGLATIRSCASSCTTGDDSLAEIDMAALAQAYTSKAPGTLLQQVIGSGTTKGHLYGIGAWGNSVYAFSRESSASGGSAASPAELVQIDSTGAGTSLQMFSAITNGWSGAGVTTAAPVTIIK